MASILDKNIFLSHVDWCTPKQRRGINTLKDVSITKVKCAEDTRMSMTFRNGVGDKVSDTGYIAIGFCKDRILFGPTEEGEGYKLAKRPKESNRYVQFKSSEKAFSFIGDYDLMYDDFLEMYYIEKKVGDLDA